MIDTSKLISREHQADGRRSLALFSACMRYRYSLRRDWMAGTGRVLFVMLNPSTADEARNDPTVERCERRARAMGFAGFEVCNIFAWRETDPRALRRVAEPEGPCNDAVLAAAQDRASLVVCAWGVHGAHRNQGPRVAGMLRARGPLTHLGLTKAGHPRHPLYVGYDTRPKGWT